MMNIHTLISDIELSGVVVRGIENIDKTLANSSLRCPKLQLRLLFNLDRDYGGITFYSDPESFDSEEFNSRLINLGFEEKDALVIVQNIKPVPPSFFLNRPKYFENCIVRREDDSKLEKLHDYIQSYFAGSISSVDALATLESPEWDSHFWGSDEKLSVFLAIRSFLRLELLPFSLRAKEAMIDADFTQSLTLGNFGSKIKAAAYCLDASTYDMSPPECFSSWIKDILKYSDSRTPYAKTIKKFVLDMLRDKRLIVDANSKAPHAKRVRPSNINNIKNLSGITLPDIEKYELIENHVSSMFCIDEYQSIAFTATEFNKLIAAIEDKITEYYNGENDTPCVFTSINKNTSAYVFIDSKDDLDAFFIEIITDNTSLVIPCYIQRDQNNAPVEHDISELVEKLKSHQIDVVNLEQNLIELLFMSNGKESFFTE